MATSIYKVINLFLIIQIALLLLMLHFCSHWIDVWVITILWQMTETHIIPQVCLSGNTGNIVIATVFCLSDKFMWPLLVLFFFFIDLALSSTSLEINDYYACHR